jgi:hypothetical protein
MKTRDDNEKAIKQMAHLGAELENNLLELQQLDSSVKHLQLCVHDIHIQKELNTMRNRALILKSLLSVYHAELNELRNHSCKSDGVITIGEIIMRNKLRDKVLRAEQDVLILKAAVHQLLSKAS